MVARMTSTFGFPPGQPPEWDIERFMRGDEVDTAVITLERNRRTFAWKCARVGAEGCVCGSARRRSRWEACSNTWRGSRSSITSTGSPVVSSGRRLTNWTSRATGKTGPGVRRPMTPPMRCVRSGSTLCTAPATRWPRRCPAVDWSRRPQTGMSMRRLLADMIEEYARHTGHADLLREQVDGATGEGAPQDFPVP